MSLGKNIVAVTTTLGVASGSHKAVDQEKMAQILEKSDILARVNKRKSVAERGKPPFKLLLFDACYSGGINTKISKELFELSTRKLNITSISAAQAQQTALEG
jgi:hypothetical protein